MMVWQRLASGDHARRPDYDPCRSRVFLLSPANSSAIRGQLLLNRNSDFELAHRFRQEGAPLGEIFSFISSLYFRGKLAYAEAFANSPPGFPSTLAMTSSRGLLPPETTITLEDLLEMSSVPIDLSDRQYREPLVKDAGALARLLPPGSKIVLLGSIASGKYIDPLLEVFGADLLFPEKFVGRGDMSRGGLMLRCAQSGLELDYVPVISAIRHGTKPPKLSPLKERVHDR
jgi:hypothetical protein